jgi:rubrerythrin
MTTNTLFQKKHELWLAILFGSFSIEDEALADVLYDFAMIEYRHMVWLAQDLVDSSEEFDFEKNKIDFQSSTNFELFNKLIIHISETKSIYQNADNPMYQRFSNDEEYFLEKLKSLLKDSSNNKNITAFTRERKYLDFNLEQSQSDALTLFLFEETYKEYELILVYTYSNLFTNSKLLSSVFIDLIYESIFHLKSFARMLSRMGLLAVPRTVATRVYQFDDMEQFLLDGIEEEEAAKEQCLRLASEIKNRELSSFFNFINYQESYHIELMKKALEHLKG